MAKSTLDQQRAQFAWERATAARRSNGEFEKYRNLAKGAPALVMGNGLMSALAFWQSRKKEDSANQLLSDVLEWLARRDEVKGAQFGDAMASFTAMSSAEYMAATGESLALLRWLRQCADAVA